MPTATLRASNVLQEGGQFEWRIRESGEVRLEDISASGAQPSLSREEEAELERLYEKYRSNDSPGA
jgi:hypothetical protein